MSTMIGADVAELRALAADFDTKASALRTTETQLNWRIHSSPWHGPDVSRFQHDWNTRHRRAITTAAASMTDAARELRANADQQELASDATFTGSVPSVAQLRDAELQRVDAAGEAGWAAVAGAFGAAFLKVLDAAHTVGKKIESAAKAYIKGRAALTSVQRWARSDGPVALLRRVIRATKGVTNGGLYKTVETGFGRVLYPIGTVLSAVELVGDVRRGDVKGATFSGGSVVLSGLATAVVFGAITGPAAPVILVAAGVWAVASLAHDHRETLMKAGSWVADKAVSGVHAVADGARETVQRATNVVRGARDAAADVVGRLTNPLRSVFG